MLAEFITSRFFGRPVELYKFTYGPRAEDVHLYTDGETPIVHGGQTYSPVTIKRGPTSSNGTLDKTMLEVVLPHTLKVPQMFRIFPPSSTVSLTILQGQAGDPDAQFVVAWAGRIVSVSFEGIEAKLSGEPISTSFRRSGLRRNYQYMCPHVVYGPHCRANKPSATTVVTVAAVSGRGVTLTSALGSAELHTGGMIEWTTSAGLPESRTILEVGATTEGATTMLLTGIPTGMTAGMSISAVRGCKHTLSACKNDHNNAVNFGGDPWIPMKNPIGNTSPFQ
jgi:hypothetical protein